MVKADGPSDDVLEDLAQELGGNWEKLGRRPGFNQAKIDNFDLTKKELEEKAFKMLMAWKQKEGSNATYKVLYDALCNKKVQCKLLAEKFCCDEIEYSMAKERLYQGFALSKRVISLALEDGKNSL